ncbi:polysaccharide deacetylase family protein [Granulicella paludicola]|uniref:polysaccharide deacetylase family protein n=1 Tax=Granulicella paludicola TaxID=474951 RepID=UPI0021E0A5B7|nr:polysaccharide deacetylase family protein [Granulicella paludicola]
MSPTEQLAIAAAATAAVASIGGTLTYAALHPGSQLFGRTIIAGNNPLEAALTYDDGPNDAVTDDLLDLLAAHNARVTFFMIGKYVRQQHALVRRIHASGHLIGNHTETHPWLAWQSDRVIREELQRCQHAIEDTLGCAVHYFRPPHGARRPAVFRAAEELELKVVQWNAMGLDWRPIGAERIVANLDRGMARAQQRGRGANLLLHDGGDIAMGADRSATIAATATLLQRWSQQGIKPVTVDAWG